MRVLGTEYDDGFILIDGFIIGAIVPYFAFYFYNPVEVITKGNFFRHFYFIILTVFIILDFEFSIMLILAVCFAILLVFLRGCCLKVAFITYAVTSLIVGYLMAACIKFLITSPEWNGSWWSQTIYMTLILALYAFTTTLSLNNGTGTILLTFAMGSYAVVQAIQFWFGSRSSYLIVNSVQAVSVQNDVHSNTASNFEATGKLFNKHVQM